jgi:DNA-binding GntR family transcriptional regulator
MDLMGLARISAPLTRHQAAVEQLREAIISGELAPGAQIKDLEIAAQLGLSSTPLGGKSLPPPGR